MATVKATDRKAKLERRAERLRKRFIYLVKLTDRIDALFPDDYFAADAVVQRAGDAAWAYARAMIEAQRSKVEQ